MTEAVESSMERDPQAPPVPGAHRAELVVEAVAPVTGWWDRARLEQVVGQQVSNAIHRAGGCVEIRVTDRGGDAEIAVRDHGPGLEPSALAQPSDPFDPDRRQASASGCGSSTR